MSTEPGKSNDGLFPAEGDSRPILPKVDDKNTGGHTMQPPIFPFGAGLPSSGVHIPDSPAELPGNPLKEGAMARIDDTVIPEIEKDNFNEVLRGIDPTISTEERAALGFFADAAMKGEPLTDANKQEIIGNFKQSHTNRETVIGIIESSPLSTKDKVDMITLAEKELSSISKEEAQEPVPQNEQAQMKANIGAMSEQIDQEEAKLKQELAEAKEHSGHDEHSEHKHHSERVERMLEKIEELREKMDEFLHPDDPLKTWTTRGGKTLYVILMVSFLFVIWEMNVINKMAGGKRGGGH